METSDPDKLVSTQYANTSGLPPIQPANRSDKLQPRISAGFSFFLIVCLGFLTLVAFPIAQGTNDAAKTAVVVFFVGIFVLYFCPSLVARLRNQPNTVSIFVLNILAGWTFVGWVAALVWAYSSIDRHKSMPKLSANLRAAEGNPAGMRDCPYCAEPIRTAATKCRHCGSDLPVPLVTAVSDTPSMIVPEPVRENELMAKYGIKFDGYLYLFGEYKYAKLDDAVRYAKIGK